MAGIRPPAVAGTFYPGSARELGAEVDALLAAAAAREEATPAAPKALIAPHAGYLYSGAVAASAFRWLATVRDRIRRVVLLGPSHFVALRGLALPAASGLATPLGTVPVDADGAARAAALPQVAVRDDAHAREHSLEVHLPFLQRALDDFAVVPLVVGDAEPEEVGAVIEALWGGEETLIDVSSDLSHYLDYDAARRRDRRTCAAVEALRYEDLGEGDACGRVPLRGLLWAARRHSLSAATLDLRNSGDTAGPRDRVVGYGAWAFAVGSLRGGLVAAAALLALLAFPSTAAAHRDDYLDESLVFVTLESGEVEAEYWFDYGQAEGGADASFVRHNAALEYGITERTMIDGRATLRRDGGGATLFDSGRIEARHRFGEEGDRVVDVAVSAEVNAERDEAGEIVLGIEPRLILSKDFGSLNVTLNLSEEIPLDHGQASLLVALGVREALSARLRLGGELHVDTGQSTGSLIPQVWFDLGHHAVLKLGYSFGFGDERDSFARLAFEVEF